jgi:hypothetical protein
MTGVVSTAYDSIKAQRSAARSDRGGIRILLAVMTRNQHDEIRDQIRQ